MLLLQPLYQVNTVINFLVCVHLTVRLLLHEIFVERRSLKKVLTESIRCYHKQTAKMLDHNGLREAAPLIQMK